eukprot:6186450-Pleurochrysis_carterae.AAC.4
MVVSMGTGEGERKQKELEGTGGVCAKSVATVNARSVGKLIKVLGAYLAFTNVSVWSLPASTSDLHALRHVADCRLSARGNLHRDLDLVAGRPAV